MTRREKLQENFEDALFALLMEEVAEQEGQRLLEENEKLKRDPESTVPPEVDRRCLKNDKAGVCQDTAAGSRAYGLPGVPAGGHGRGRRYAALCHRLCGLPGGPSQNLKFTDRSFGCGDQYDDGGNA